MPRIASPFALALAPALGPRLHPADDAPGYIPIIVCMYLPRALRALHTYREDGGAREGAF